MSDPIVSPIEIDEQLDTSLDSGTLKYIVSEPNSKGLNEALAKYHLTQFDEATNKIGAEFDFVGIDSRAIVKKTYTTSTATSNGSVTNEEITPHLNYGHTSSGKISVKGSNIVVLSIKGNIARTYPQVKVSDGAIVWDVSWKDRNEYPDTYKYVVTVTYTYSPNSGVYSHQVSLTEPSKLLQGVMIDGFGVSQPENYDDRQTLKAVVDRLLDVTPFDDAQSKPTYKLTDNSAVVNALKAVKSPEFKWNTQASLWECLVQVGAVIDAMPMLVADSKGEFTIVTFEFVNAYENEVTSIDDGLTNAFGESVDERLYNSALSSIVENLREND